MPFNSAVKEYWPIIRVTTFNGIMRFSNIERHADAWLLKDGVLSKLIPSSQYSGTQSVQEDANISNYPKATYLVAMSVTLVCGTEPFLTASTRWSPQNWAPLGMTMSNPARAVATPAC
jgi:hypothetical protein